MNKRTTTNFFNNSGKLFIAVEISSSIDEQAGFLDFTPIDSLVSMPKGVNSFRIERDSILPHLQGWPLLKSSKYIASARPFYEDISSVALYDARIVKTGSFGKKPWEGKSTVSANLAITAAKMGIKTILVDGDLRKPVISKIFDLENHTYGFTEVLKGKSTIENSIRHSGVENLDIFPAGPYVPNPPELLNTNKIEKVLKTFEKHYDFVIVDSPPLLPVSDAVVLGSVVDGILITVRAAYTKRDALQKAVAKLQNIREKVLGTVINAIPIGAGGYYSHYYHYYGYYGYYGKEKE